MEELTAEQALRLAARDGDTSTVIRLLDAGTPVDSADMIGYTPLMLAARKGQMAILRLLIERGADWRAENRPGDAALDFAVQSGHLEAVGLLLDLEGDITGWRGRELLSRTARADVKQVLRDAGASDQTSQLSSDEVREMKYRLYSNETVLCPVCQNPLLYHWYGNSARLPASLRKMPYGLFCPNGCTDIPNELD